MHQCHVLGTKRPVSLSCASRGCVCSYQRDDDLAVRVRLERVGLREVLAHDFVVINLAVDGQCNLTIFTEKRLCSRIYDFLIATLLLTISKRTNTDDTESLVDQDYKKLVLVVRALLEIILVLLAV